MKNIKITEQYPAVKIDDGDIKYETEKNWTDRPAWKKLLNYKNPLPRFLSVQVPKYGEIIYKAFGHYYYPINYTNNEEKRFMDAMADEYDGMVANPFNIPMAKALLSRLPLKEIRKEAKILDVGCGTGIMTRLFLKEGFSNFTLVDFSKGMLAQAKNKLGNNKKIKYKCLDITKEFPKEIFDIIISVMLFNSFDDKTTDLILSRFVKQMSKDALFCVVEDTEKLSYTKYFHPIVNEMTDVGLRNKYIFIGRKR